MRSRLRDLAARPSRFAAALALVVTSAPLCDCAIDAICFEDEAGCAKPSCDDGAKNGSESDVDCGGACGPCLESASCATKADCATNYCTGGTCCDALCAIWGRSFGSLVNDSVAAAAIRSDGSILVIGFFSGAVDFGGGPLVAKGARDLFVVGLSSSGEHLFSESYGGEGDESGALVVVHPDDNATVALQSSSKAIAFGGDSVENEASINLFLVELDAKGKHVRSKVFETVSELKPGGLARADDGDVVLSGSLYNGDFGGGNVSSKGGLDVFVARLDAAWKHRWSKRFGDAWHDTGQRVAVDGDGNVIVSATYSRAWTFGGKPLPWTSGVESVAIAKFDPAGKHLWSHGYGGKPTGQHPAALIANEAGEIFLAGTFSGTADFGTGPIEAGIAISGFVVAYAPDGVARWSRAIGEHTASAQSLANDGSGGLFVAGAYRGNVDFGGGVRVEHGLDDAFVAHLDARGSALAARGFGGVVRDFGAGVVARNLPAGLRAVVFGGHREGIELPAETLASNGEYDAFVLSTGSVSTSMRARFVRRVLASAVLGAALLVPGCSLGELCVDGDIGCSMDPCRNGLRDGSESDVDCGGSCAPCEAGASCEVATDCAAGRCSGGACCTPPCSGWTKTFGGVGADHAASAVVLDDGSVVVAGPFFGTVDFGGGPREAPEGGAVFVASYGADGAYRFDRTIGGDKGVWGPVLARATGDHVWLAGLYDSATLAIEGDVLEGSGGWNDGFLVELDAKGGVVRTRAVSGRGDGFGFTRLAPAGDGGLLVLGQIGRIDFGDGVLVSAKHPPTGTTSDGFLARLDPLGDRVWSRRLGGTDDDYAMAIAVRGDAVYVAMNYRGTDSQLVGPKLPELLGGTFGFALAELGLDGTHRWSRGFPASPWASDILVDEAGALYATGRFQGKVDLGDGPMLAQGTADLFVARFDPNGGAVLWSSRAGDNDAIGLALAPDGAGGILLGARFTGDADFGNGVVASDGVDSVLLARISSEGTATWARNTGGICGALGLALASPDRALVFGGFAGTLEAGGEPRTSAGKYDAFLSSFSP